MLRSPLIALCLVVTGCRLVTGDSNLPDSGVDCADAGAVTSTGSLSGDLAFTVGSSYESRNALITGSGPDAGGSDSWIAIGLYAEVLSCHAVRAPDAGVVYQTVGIYLFDKSQQFATGSYAIGASDGGPSSALFVISSRDGGYVAGRAVSGSVTLSSLQACSLSGSIDVVLGTADGGTSPLTGSFTSAYCK